PFGVAYLLTRDNPNSEVLLIVALFCIGLAVAFAIASGLQRAGVLAVRLSGRSPRDIMIVGLAALSILTPWTITVAVANLHQLFGWTNPLAWVLAVGLVLFVMESARPYHGLALTGSSAVNDSEFAYWAHYDTTPPDRGRLDVLLGAAALVLVLLASWFDTWRSLRRREVMGDWLARVRGRSQNESP